MLALLGVPSGLRRSLSGLVSVVLPIVLPITAGVRVLIVAVWFFSIICQCSFDMELAYLAYRRSGEVYCVSLAFYGWYPKVGQTGIVLNALLLQIPSNKRSHELAVMMECLSQVDVVYRI